MKSGQGIGLGGRLAALGALAALAALAAGALGCSGKTGSVGGVDGGCGSGNPNACDAGAPATEASTAGFPFLGPSCSLAQFPTACWQCVQGACPSTEACLTTDCAAYFSCYCGCPANDATCHSSCPQTAACQTCASNVSLCQEKSCAASCGADGGAPQTTCAPLRACAGGGELQGCSVTSGGLCQSQYYTVGSQTFACAACSDCSAAGSAAAMACP